MTPVFEYAASLKRMGNDAGLFQEMVELFREDAPKYLSAIHEATRQGDFGTIKRSAHTLKGLALNFGAARATSAAIALEFIASAAVAQAAEQANIPAALEELESSVAELQQALETRQESPSGPGRVSRR